MGSGQSTQAPPPAPPTAANMAADVKTMPDGSKPKPCCVCTDEKAARDKCMLFSDAADPQKDCADLILKYKDCMATYGFKI